MAELDPNGFVNIDEAFDDEWDDQPDEIRYAEFGLISGLSGKATLIYKSDGISLEGGATGTKWAIALYSGYHYNGQDIPIRERAARHVLETISGMDSLDEYEWTAQNWTYFE